ncbi:MAG: fructosamine kinase family protein, partial [Gammaproteobacteria bacterium]|nr:fructosamine kinase family protein [Gammaproteobacteria bacterium]
MQELALAGAALIGATPRDVDAEGGGDLATVARVLLDDGREAIVKQSPAPAVEADMLDAIRATGAPAPAVLGHDAGVLVLELLPGGGNLGSAWHDLGAVMARLHAARGDYFGWPKDYAFGPVGIDNATAADWAVFWAERRLANQTPHLPPALAARVERLAGQLSDRLPALPPPALLHGDLWSGNIVVDRARVSGLIDPACYYGHAEVDFAMLSLFGQPGPAL